MSARPTARDRAYDAIIAHGMADLSSRELARMAGVGKSTACAAMQDFRADLARGHAGRLLREGRAAQFESTERYYDGEGRLIRTEKIVLEPEEEKIFADDSQFDHEPDTVTDHA